MNTNMIAKGFLLLLLTTGLGSGFLYAGGKKDAAPLPEGDPIGGGPVAAPAANLSADQRDLQTVARVTLAKSEHIFVAQLRRETERQSKLQKIPAEITPMEFSRRVLDNMINERLVLQAAERAGITSPRAELDQQLEMVRASVGRPISDKEFQDGIEDQYGMSFAAFQTYLHEDMVRQKYIEQHIIQEADKAGESVSEATINDEIQNLRDEMTVQNGRALSDDEFNDLIKKQGMDMTALRGNIRRQLTARNYLIGLSGGPPSEDKIQTLYNQNKTTFVRPDTISFNLIGVPFKKEDAAGKAAARARAEELARKIGSSSLVFNEEFALAETSRHARPVKYFQLSPDNPQIQQVFGLDFIDKAMSLAENAVSGVIEGRQGFFIIKVTSKYPQEILGLDSLYRLGGSATVRDMIRAQLMQQALANGMAVATSALVEELRKEASVEINEELLLW